MKLVIAMVPNRLTRRVRERLLAEGVGYTQLASTGGFLRTGNTTLLICLPAARVNDLLAALAEVCEPRKTTLNMPGADLHSYANPAGRVEQISVGGLFAMVLSVDSVVHL